MVIVFLVLTYAGLLLLAAGACGSVAFSSVATHTESFKQQSVWLSGISRTSIGAATSYPHAPYLDIVVHNNGQHALPSFSNWDVVVRYTDALGGFHHTYLAYAASVPPGDNQWTLLGIYLDREQTTPEVFQPGILNPGEYAVLRARLDPAADDSEANEFTIVTYNGVTVTGQWRRWQALADTPAEVGPGGALAFDGTLVYALRGGNTNHFWAYNPAANVWSSLPNTQGTVNEGGALVYAESGGSRYLFALRGGNRRTFWRYDIAAGTWSNRASTPGAVSWGGALAWDGADTIYALGGNLPLGLQLDFWSYSISLDLWTPLTPVPLPVNEGGALAYLNSLVYALRGGTSDDAWRYSPSVLTWASVADTPAAMAAGGALATNGAYLFALRGGATRDFWRYDVAADVWRPLMDTPSSVGGGGALTFASGSFYALAGGNTTNFWRY